ncbi:GntR family transcriptional regulator [Paenarthrobacter sp. NPDC089675]|uniref:GntR family transcriptional regulator n=1 Tax=Paenarthrobacter TaxID=1742992 RepID=UPI0037F856AC
MSSWRERLAFAPLETAERGEEIALRLRHSIELGVLEDGTQLPSESELAAKMRVSTMTLRTALAELRHLGLLETRRGKGGGSFVRANTGDIAKAQRDTLARYSLEHLRDVREYRAFLSGSAAAVAAGRSQQVPIGRLSSMAALIGTAQTSAEMTRADSQFHIELAATSGSVLFTRQEITMQAEVGALVWADAPDRRIAAANEHAMIVDAVRAGNATDARALAEEHVRRDMNRLIDLRMSIESPTVPPSSSEGSDSAVYAVESFTADLKEAVAASIGIVEEAAQEGLDHAKFGRLDELENVYDVARERLQAMPALYGTGFIAEQSYFGAPGSIWCYLPSGAESPQRFEFEMGPEFYDYSTAPWWPAPDADAEVHTSYAYIDALGTNEHVITFTKRVTRAGKMAGLAAADILISRLQTEFAPLMQPLPPNTCIVDQNEVVIATNTASLVGATLSRSHQVERRIALPQVPWSLCLRVNTRENTAGSAR